jgi:hypothetical protein
MALAANLLTLRVAGAGDVSWTKASEAVSSSCYSLAATCQFATSRLPSAGPDCPGLARQVSALDSIASSDATAQRAGARVVDFNVNLHGFTRLAARQFATRAACDLIPDMNVMMKFNVGRGLHSVDKEQVLRAAVSDAVHDITGRYPEADERNPGYIEFRSHEKRVDPAEQGGSSGSKMSGRSADCSEKVESDH